MEENIKNDTQEIQKATVIDLLEKVRLLKIELGNLIEENNKLQEYNTYLEDTIKIAKNDADRLRSDFQKCIKAIQEKEELERKVKYYETHK